MTAGLEGRLEHQLQDPRTRLIAPTRSTTWDAQTPLPASGLQMNPDGRRRPVGLPPAARSAAKESFGAFGLRFLDRLFRRCPVRPRCAPHSAAPTRLASDATSSAAAASAARSNSCVPIACASLFAAGTPRRWRDEAAPLLPPPSGLSGEHEAQLTVTILSNPSLPLLRGHCPASSLIQRDPTSGRASAVVVLLPAYRYARPVPEPPGFRPWMSRASVLTAQPRLDFRRRVRRHAHPGWNGLSRRPLAFGAAVTSAFSPHRPRGAAPRVSRRTMLHASYLRLTVAARLAP